MSKATWIAILLLASNAWGGEVNGGDKLLAFPNFGVSLSAPAGWKEMPREMPQRVIQWISPESSPNQLQAKVVVEGAKPVESDAQTTATKMAKSWGGSVPDEKTSLDGEPAYRILVTKRGADLQPVEGIIAFHDGYLYLIMGGVAGDHVCHEAVEQVRKSWKWSGFESPAKHLEFRKEPYRLGDTVTMAVPELMQTYPVEHPDLTLDLGLYYLPKGDSVFLSIAQILPRTKGQTFDALKDGFLAAVKQRLELPADLQWQTGKGELKRVMTPLVKASNIPGTPPGSTKPIIYALVELDENRVMLVNFTVPADASEHRVYAEVAAKMVDSIAVVNKPAKPRAGDRP
jgi:hypothetical protein